MNPFETIIASGASSAPSSAPSAAPFGGGNVVPEDFPEEWGGRPKGKTRRAQRMQEEWDKKRGRQIEEYKLMRQEYESDRSFYLQERNQQMDQQRFGFQQAEKEAERKLKDQMDYEANGFIQGFNNLDPQSPDYRQGIADLRKQFPVGGLDPRVEKIVQDYDAMHEIYMQNISDRQAEAESMDKERQKIAKISEQSGQPMSNFITTDPRTGRDVINYEALGRAEAAASQKETKPEEPLIGGKTQKEIDKLITGIGAEIAVAEATGDVDNKLDGLKAKKEYYEGLRVQDNKGVANTAQSQYIPVEEREVGKTYPTPQGELKWTGTGWVKP